MTPVPQPRPSPEVPHDVAPDETVTGVYRISMATAFATRVQWAIIGTICLSLAGFIGWGINTLTVVNTAQAQTSAKADAAAEQGRLNSIRIEAVDAGTRAAIERLERKIDTNDEKHDRQVQALDQKLDLVLREVRKR